eukprot:220903_1
MSTMLSNTRQYFEQNIVVQYVATFLCSFQTLIASSISRASNNKYVVGTIVIILGSVYPLILKYTKNGQSKYPFMIGVAVCVKNVFMLIYYFARYFTFLYSQRTRKVYNYEYMSDGEPLSDPDSYTYSSQHHLVTDNTSHYGHTNSLEYTHRHMHSLVSPTPSKLSWALSVLKSPDKRLAAPNDENDDDNTHQIEAIEMEPVILTSPETPSVSSKQIKMKQKCTEWVTWDMDGIKHRLKLYWYLAPNAVLVLMNDILALYTLSFVSVATYAVFMQVTILFIVIV